MKTKNTQSIKPFFALFLTVVFIAMVNAGCAALNTQLRSKPMPYKGQTKVERIYIYSFLDFRENEIGKKFLEALKVQLEVQLKLHGVVSEQLWYSESPVNSEFSMAKAPVGYTRIPVKEVISANASKEKSFEPSHVLIIFPSSVEAAAGGNFNIKWSLTGTNTISEDWSAETFSSAFNWASADENYSGRAQQLATFIVNEMVKSKVFY